MDCTSGCPTGRGVWSAPEHERFIEAMSLYPRGPWKLIRDHVGTRSIKQVQTHAQKYQQKLLRQQRGLRKRKVNVKRPEHRVDPSTLDQFTHKCIVRYAQRLGKGQQRDGANQHVPDKVDRTKSAPAPLPPVSVSSSAASTPTSVTSTVDASLAGVTLGDWLAMAKDAAADAKLLELLPEMFPPNGDDDDDGDERSSSQLLKLEQPPKDWSVSRLDLLLYPAATDNQGGHTTTMATATAERNNKALLQSLNTPAPSA